MKGGLLAWLGRWRRPPRLSRRAMRDPARMGREGEWLTHRHLLRLGYDVLARNWRAPFGEVDLVARRDGAIHLVEVKTRRRHPGLKPEDRVDREKMERYRSLGVYFMKAHRLEGCSLRCHLAALTVDEDRTVSLEFFENAF